MRRGGWLFLAAAIGAALAMIPVAIHLDTRATQTGASAASDPRPAADPSYPADWSSYAAPDGSFELMAPGQAVARAIQTDRGPGHEVAFDDGRFTAAWTDVPAPGSDQQLLTDEENSVFHTLAGTVADEEVLSAGDAPGFGLSFSLGGTSYRMRGFAVQGRFFDVVAAVPSGTDAVGDAERFVTSLELH